MSRVDKARGADAAGSAEVVAVCGMSAIVVPGLTMAAFAMASSADPPMSTVTLYHNPRCSTSRHALELLKARGIEPVVIEYLKNPPTADELRRIAAATGQPLRALIRTKQPEYLEQGLDNPALTDDELLAAMVATPVLINRPIVVTEKGARLGRPLQAIEQVL